MAGIYTYQYQNNLGHTVDITIQRGSAVGRTLTLADNPIKVTYNVEDEDDIFSPIMTSRCEVRVIVTDDEDGIEFFEDMSIAKDGEWRLDMLVFDGSNQLESWSGFIIPDGMQRGISYRNDIVIIRAVDVLERAKSFKVTKTDGSQFVGRYKLRDYIDAIITNAWGGLYEYEENSKIVLTNNPETPTVWPPITEALWVDATAFNDNNGRPINAFDALKIIAKALGARIYFEDNKVILREVLTYNERPGSTWLNVVGIKSDTKTNDFLIGNQEVLTRSRTFKEVKGSFDYEGADGVMQNGNMQFYDVDGKPSSVDINASLQALPDLNVRRRGNGRTENPYGFVLKSTYAEPGTPIISRHLNTYDMLAFNTPAGVSVPRYTEISIEVTARLEDVGEIAVQQDQTYTAMIVDAIIYNDSDPSQSVRSMLNPDGVPTWETVDLSSNALFGSGQYDFSVNARDNDQFALFPPPGDLLIPLIGVSRFVSQFGTPIKFAGVKDTSQTQGVDLAPNPVSGRLYVSVSQIFDAGPMSIPTIGELNSSTEMDTRIESVLVSAKGLNDGKTETVYQTRFGDHTTEKKEFELELGTSANPTTKGALWTDITYQDDDTKVGRFYRGPGWVKGIQHEDFSLGLPSPWNGYMSLLMYNAMARMAFNRVQNKMDFTCLSERMPIGNVIFFPDLSDPDRPSTSLYVQPHIQQMQTWDVTTGERNVTVISLAKDIRVITSEGQETPTTDLVERYYQ